MSSPVTARTCTEQALAAIDSALAADEAMCFCGCAHLVTAASPSLYFAAQECSELWHRAQRVHPADPEQARIFMHNQRVNWEANERRSWPGSLPHAGRIGDVDDTPIGYDGTTPWRDLSPAQRRLWMNVGERRNRMPQTFPGDASTWRGLSDGARAWWWERQDDVDRTMAATDWAVGAYRDPAHPEHAAVRHAADTPPPGFMRRMARMVRDALYPPAQEVLDAERDSLMRHLRATIGEGNANLWEALRADEQAQQLREGGTWSITFLADEGLAGGGSLWRVDVGRLSENLWIRRDQSHHEIVMACVDRLRAQQNGRL